MFFLSLHEKPAIPWIRCAERQIAWHIFLSPQANGNCFVLSSTVCNLPAAPPGDNRGSSAVHPFPPLSVTLRRKACWCYVFPFAARNTGNIMDSLRREANSQAYIPFAADKWELLCFIVKVLYLRYCNTAFLERREVRVSGCVLEV